jgi:hypothetical protein
MVRSRIYASQLHILLVFRHAESQATLRARSHTAKLIARSASSVTKRRWRQVVGSKQGMRPPGRGAGGHFGLRTFVEITQEIMSRGYHVRHRGTRYVSSARTETSPMTTKRGSFGQSTRGHSPSGTQWGETEERRLAKRKVQMTRRGGRDIERSVVNPGR